MARRLNRDEYLWVGGAACLDFSNTRSYRPTPNPLDRLDTYDHLLDWAGFAGLFSAGRLRGLRLEAASHPRSAKIALKKAKMLREAIYRICSKQVNERKVQTSDLDELNRAIEQAMRHRKLVRSASLFQWNWNSTADLTQVLWPISQSAAELLVSEQMRWVRECSLETCSALFLDSSKNKKRRWCDMTDCGNLAKARKHRSRKRSQRPAR